MSHEPIKPLFEDASAPSELRNFVTLARSDGASQADLDRLAKRMAPVLGVSAAFIASSAAAVGSTAPLATGGAFGAPASGLTPALGAGAAGAKVGAGTASVVKAGVVKAGVAKAGLFSQLLASAGAKVLAVSLSIGAAGAAVYGATTLERPPSGPQVPVSTASSNARHALPGGSAAASSGQGTTAPEVVEGPLARGTARFDNPLPAAGAAPLNQVAQGAPDVVELAPRSAAPSAAARAHKPGALAARSAPKGDAQPATTAAAEQLISDDPVATQPVEKPSLPPPSELSLIERAEASRSRPNEALAFLAKHEEVYPRGALAQEREVLAIELLLKAGKLGQAETRADRFEDAYPRSAHLLHLRALLTRAQAK